MSRSPLAYPLTRGIDGDSGGAADLQTDVMRFMAILALCLVAIFALVQSIPLAQQPAPAPEPIFIGQADALQPEPVAEPEPVAATVEPEPAPPKPEVQPFKLTRPARKPAQIAEPEPSLTRPEWTPRPTPERVVDLPPTPVEPVAAAPEPTPAPPEPVATPAPEQEGFSLRFASDQALTRLVAAGQVGFYAIDTGRARRMSVRESRISFWDASTPSSFHEMEARTVPGPVVDALRQSGVNTSQVNWGVTLPGSLQRQLDALMREHRGGALVIHPDGQLRLEAS